MKIIDRATRGMAARFIWGGLVVLFLIGLFLVRSQKTTALNTEIQDAQERAMAYARTTVADQAVVDSRAGTITFDKKGFDVSVEGDIFTDPTVARVRVWDRDGVLLASSDPSEVVGQLATTKDSNFTSVVVGATHAQVVQEDFTFSTVGSAPRPTQLLEVFTPLQTKDNVDPLGVVQIDLLYSKLEAAAATPWTTLALACLVGAIVAGILFVAAMVRKPVRVKEAYGETVAPEVAAEPPVAVAAAEAPRDPELEEELKVAREQLQQASEAFAFLEARVKDGSGAQANAADVDAAASRISELEAALQRAQHDAAEARSSSVSQEELDQVRRQADARVAEMERQMHEDAAKVDPELEALRAQLAEAERRAKDAEHAMASARADVEAAREEVVTAPNGEVSNGLIEELEAKVAEAEARAKEAEEEALRITPEANDLRARLAQAAARKKLGPSG
jgi:hypothetical protein